MLISSIIGTGLMPVPPPAPSKLKASIFASEANFIVYATAEGRYAPVFRKTFLAPCLRSQSMSSMKRFLFRYADSAVSLKSVEDAVFECLLNHWVFWVRDNDVAAFL